MKGQTLGFREVGLPIGTAEETFNSEDDVRTRVFLKKVVRLIYADPVKGKNYLESGKFLQDCIRTHRGFWINTLPTLLHELILDLYFQIY